MFGLLPRPSWLKQPLTSNLLARTRSSNNKVASFPKFQADFPSGKRKKERNVGKKWLGSGKAVRNEDVRWISITSLNLFSFFIHSSPRLKSMRLWWTGLERANIWTGLVPFSPESGFFGVRIRTEFYLSIIRSLVIIPI